MSCTTYLDEALKELIKLVKGRRAVLIIKQHQITFFYLEILQDIILKFASTSLKIKCSDSRHGEGEGRMRLLRDICNCKSIKDTGDKEDKNNDVEK